jgi:hypothetical protein
LPAKSKKRYGNELRQKNSPVKVAAYGFFAVHLCKPWRDVQGKAVPNAASATATRFCWRVWVRRRLEMLDKYSGVCVGLFSMDTERVASGGQFHLIFLHEPTDPPVEDALIVFHFLLELSQRYLSTLVKTFCDDARSGLNLLSNDIVCGFICHDASSRFRLDPGSAVLAFPPGKAIRLLPISVSILRPRRRVLNLQYKF